MARTQKMRRLGGWFRSRVSKLMTICFSGVALFSAGQAVAEKLREGILNRRLEEGGTLTMSEPQFDNGVATCSLSAAAATSDVQSAAAALTLSKDMLSVELQCSGAKNIAVPKDLTNVCKPKDAATTTKHRTAEKCKFGKSAQSPEGDEIALHTLLGAGERVKWIQKTQAKTGDDGQTWSLTLTEEDLPLKDTPFFVGCQSEDSVAKSASNDSCKVPVHVEARPSAVADNVATCAYGQKSNGQALEVEVTAEKNFVTVECGSVGAPMTGITTAEYCAPEEANLDTCTAKKYIDVLPMFEESWVKQNDAKSSLTLTIPENGFPAEDQKLRLLCVPKKTAENPSRSNAADKTFGEATTNCNVFVTVKAANSATSATSTLQVMAAASGAVAVTGIIVSSL
ncbi:SAG-related sequence SRS19C [Toxoplasma gondii ME49]|uniref:SAG-related sequence SRS19C n=3 Tax=Toxoplasma gondii TaxID=5811 RepID=S7UHG9_TOXGG|nr:SAG-related sequence SRS19C [Toxoplasma gondii ME49]EPR57182.1 SAG-related sequence SRS19C [Toxoplasma gondii GT1]EPT31335.1 SAG-related sequence SRS19C [Toxoplasma gondii ME49]KAF4645168.1 SAG-related sequence SRS19C [Toxoplasma gondii]|eukprot:XP_002371638.1 SAG-related sequence SRS19C [Toxoplasma gondii ME49]